MARYAKTALLKLLEDERAHLDGCNHDSRAVTFQIG